MMEIEMSLYIKFDKKQRRASLYFSFLPEYVNEWYFIFYNFNNTIYFLCSNTI